MEIFKQNFCAQGTLLKTLKNTGTRRKNVNAWESDKEEYKQIYYSVFKFLSLYLQPTIYTE